MHEKSHPFPRHPSVYSTLLSHSVAPRTNTDLILSTSIRNHHRDRILTVLPLSSVRLLDFATNSSRATAVIDEDTPSHIWQSPQQRPEEIWFAKYAYSFAGRQFILYLCGWKGEGVLETTRLQYLLSKPGDAEALARLLKEASEFESTLHREIWVFDGYWEKSRRLFEEIEKASWKKVVLEEALRNRILADVPGFFANGGDVYRRLGIAWRRGVIFHGPPGNGKTLSIKALMKTVMKMRLEDPGPQQVEGEAAEKTPTVLYVKTLQSWQGEEGAVKEIFSHARKVAPCLLVFEDLDSLISDEVRSYFLNEVDGIGGNDGVCMIGSTNHLERLDPGISKRPSRFDRKYLFPDPEEQERVAYCYYWQEKLKDNKDVELTDNLCKKIAALTKGFSYAYMKEMFVATLMLIAGGAEQSFKELIKEQIKLLREDLDDPKEDSNGSKKDLDDWRKHCDRPFVRRSEAHIAAGEEVKKELNTGLCTIFPRQEEE